MNKPSISIEKEGLKNYLLKRVTPLLAQSWHQPLLQNQRY